MRIVLLRSVDKLGIAGDSVVVRPGYYRNFHGPRGLAVLATPGNHKIVESRRKKLNEVVLAERSEAEKLRDSLKGLELLFTLRANDKGQLFGAVTNADVTQGLKDKGWDFDRRKVELGGNIKTLGMHHARVRLYPEIHADINIKVERLLLPGEVHDEPEAAPAAAEPVAAEAAAE